MKFSVFVLLCFWPCVQNWVNPDEFKKLKEQSENAPVELKNTEEPAIKMSANASNDFNRISVISKIIFYCL